VTNLGLRACWWTKSVGACVTFEERCARTDKEVTTPKQKDRGGGLKSPILAEISKEEKPPRRYKNRVRAGIRMAIPDVARFPKKAGEGGERQ